MKSNSVQRRKFLQAALAAAAASAVSCGGRASPWRFLTVEEAGTLAAVVDRIIPPDQDPGAGAPLMWSTTSTASSGARSKKHRRAYREGLAALGRFASLAPAEQDALLGRMEARRSEFFDLVRDPRHAGLLRRSRGTAATAT